MFKSLFEAFSNFRAILRLQRKTRHLETLSIVIFNKSRYQDRNWMWTKIA